MHHSFLTKISILQIEQSCNYQLDIITDDRNGLLSLISDKLSEHDVSINHAKINTLGSRVEDTFLITYKDNQVFKKIKQDQLIKELKELIG